MISRYLLCYEFKNLKYLNVIAPEKVYLSKFAFYFNAIH